jgi:hypothetical protein
MRIMTASRYGTVRWRTFSVTNRCWDYLESQLHLSCDNGEPCCRGQERRDMARCDAVGDGCGRTEPHLGAF